MCPGFPSFQQIRSGSATRIPGGENEEEGAGVESLDHKKGCKGVGCEGVDERDGLIKVKGERLTVQGQEK